MTAGALYAYENAAEIGTFKELEGEGNVTRSVKLNSGLSRWRQR
jgi:hypothetical protein